MGFLDDIKKVFAPSDEYTEEPEEETAEETEEKEEEPREKTPARLLKNDRKKVVGYVPGTQMQLVLCKPERYEDVPSVADHLNERKTVVLNLESANRESSRRIVDFLSGVAYAIGGDIKKIANSTYVVTPNNVNVMGELMLEDFENGNLYL